VNAYGTATAKWLHQQDDLGFARDENGLLRLNATRNGKQHFGEFDELTVYLSTAMSTAD
jgi:hypothetical protein